ncbi:MAG: beta-galactosidase [Armatimonadota bacterium]
MKSLIALLLALFSSAALAQQTASQWVWYPEQPASECVRETRWFRKTFDLAEKPKAATLWLLVDDNQQLWVNGRGPLTPVLDEEQHVSRYDLSEALQAGRNVLALTGHNGGGPAGVIARLIITQADGAELIINSDASWRAHKPQPPAEWINTDFDDTQWQPVRVIGSAFLMPWYDHALFNVTPFITPAEAKSYQAYMNTLLVAPEKFAREKPARAAIKQHNGAPALFVNGQPRPLVMYRGTVDPFTENGRRILGEFRDAGIHGYAPYVALDKCWTGPGQYNWRTIDEQVRAYLAVDPDAYLDILVRLVPPRWWFEAHPEEMVAYATSDKIDSSDESGRVLRPSPASELWRKDVGEAWTALIKHMETAPWGKRVIGWHACYGIYAEWHYFGSWTQQYPDTGAAMTRNFREYLKAKYATDQALQQAWHDPEVKLRTAQVPGVKPRQYGALLSFRDPQKDQAAIDYYRCQHKVTADAIEYFGKLAKQASGGRAIYGVYYWYFMGVLPQTQGGHLDLLRLLKSPYIDYFVAPYEYGNRLMGMDGRLRSLSNVFNLAGKAHIIEADTRTYLHPREEHGRTQNLTESLAAIRREFTTGLIEHTGYWYVDFGPENVGGWYSQPQIMATIKDLYKLAEEMLPLPRKSVAEVALVCDLDSAYYLSDGEGMMAAYKLIMDTTRELYRTGASFDAILLPQLATADLSQYKTLIFLNTTAMTDKQAVMMNKLRESGKHAMVFLWAPGVTGPDGVSAERVKRATGFTVKLQPVRSPGTMLVTQPNHPLMRGLPVTETYTLKPTGGTAIEGFERLESWLNPRSKVYMEDHYKQYDLQPTPGGVTWTLDTADAWSDLHWQGAVQPVDGLGFEVAIKGQAAQINLRCVIKDANLAEFVTPAETFTDSSPRTLAYPLTAFANAPWSKQKPEHPALPLKGMKFVVDGISSIGPVTVALSNLRVLTGETITTQAARFGDATFGPLVTPVPEPGTTVLGHIEGRSDGLLAIRGKSRSLSVYCPIPYLPREVLANVLDEAGVHRYDSNLQDVLRADSHLLAIHTKEGGQRMLRLPSAGRVTDAVTGQKVGEAKALPLMLPQDSTTILRLSR